MADVSARLGLPLLVPGQGQKDITHNEALLQLDMLVQPVVLTASALVAPENREAGACWLVPPGAGSDWAGRDGEIACWTSGGWRFVVPREGWTVWVADEAVALRRVGGIWRNHPSVGAPVVPPSGGAVVDAEARIAINALLDRLRDSGVIGLPAS